eukprot:364597-Chlamydomonas_euryale.AAC.11
MHAYMHVCTHGGSACGTHPAAGRVDGATAASALPFDRSSGREAAGVAAAAVRGDGCVANAAGRPDDPTAGAVERWGGPAGHRPPPAGRSPSSCSRPSTSSMAWPERSMRPSRCGALATAEPANGPEIDWHVAARVGLRSDDERAVRTAGRGGGATRAGLRAARGTPAEADRSPARVHELNCSEGCPVRTFLACSVHLGGPQGRHSIAKLTDDVARRPTAGRTRLRGAMATPGGSDTGEHGAEHAARDGIGTTARAARLDEDARGSFLLADLRPRLRLRALP